MLSAVPSRCQCRGRFAAAGTVPPFAGQRPGTPLSSTAMAIHAPETATSAAVTQIAGSAAWASCAELAIAYA
jgi:hypothetical protein